MFSMEATEAFELPATPLEPPLPPPRSIYRTYSVLKPVLNSNQTYLNMSSPSMTRSNPTKPIIHQRPLVLRTTSYLPTPVAHLSTQYSAPAILPPTATLVPTASASPSNSPPRTPNRTRSIPLPANISTTARSSPLVLSPSRTASTLTSLKDPSPTKSLRQKAFDRVQSPSPVPGHTRHRPSTGQRLREGAFFAFVLLPLSCWYTRGGRMLGPAGSSGALKMENELNDEEDDTDWRGPRMLERGDMADRRSISRTPTLTRRMSEDTYARRNSLSRTSTTTAPIPINKRDGIDRARSMTRERSNTMSRRGSIDRANSMTRTNTMGRRDSFDRTGSMMRTSTVGWRQWEAERGRENFDREMGVERMSMGMPPPIMAAERWV